MLALEGGGVANSTELGPGLQRVALYLLALGPEQIRRILFPAAISSPGGGSTVASQLVLTSPTWKPRVPTA